MEGNQQADARLSLFDAYRLLMNEAGDRLGAHHAELLLCSLNGEQMHSAAQYGTPQPEAHWIELPIRKGVSQIGLLRMAFSSASPDTAQHILVSALGDLATLLLEAHEQSNYEPFRRAGRRILAVTEEELQRIILDLHDGPVQKLFVVSSRLALLQSQLTNAPEELRCLVSPTINQLTGLVESALQEIKTTLSTFRPANFQRRSLSSVLQGLAFQHEVLTGHQVDLYISGQLPAVSLPVKIALYRVLQEALSNGTRHAFVDSQEVYLSSQNGWVILEVCDEGIGFTPPPLEGPDATEREEHIGLRGMRERVHLVGGQLQIISHPGQGTQIVVRVPSDA